MSQQAGSELQVELSALRQRLDTLEAYKNGKLFDRASRPQRIGLSRKILLGALSVVLLLGVGGLLHGQGALDALILDKDGNARVALILDKDRNATFLGNVGIGTAKPAVRLEVKGGQTSLEQEKWQTPNLLGLGLWNASPEGARPAYFKDSQGVVHLRGLATAGERTEFRHQPIFALPEGYRPETVEVFLVCSGRSCTRFGYLVISHHDGHVALRGGDGHMVSLSGISFRAAEEK